MSLKKHIPNTITSMNLLCGVLGVIFTMNGDFGPAFLLMLGASVCDFADGLAARALKAYSAMGKELDSLSDLVSFGVLPSLMLHKLMLLYTCGPVWFSYFPVLLAIFSALRLAKFNVDERQHESFLGLAVPASAMLCGSFVYFIACGNIADGMLLQSCLIYQSIPVIVVVLCSLLVSELPMFSFKMFTGHKTDRFTKTLRINYMVLVLGSVIFVVAAGLNWSLIVFLSILWYIMLNCFAHAGKLRKKD